MKSDSDIKRDAEAELKWDPQRPTSPSRSRMAS